MAMKTPGVYIVEKNAFPNSAVAVETSIPAFIGYTEKTKYEGQSYQNKAVRISSFLEFEERFGKGSKSLYDLYVEVDPTGSKKNADLNVNDVSYVIEELKETKFNLYESVQLFYLNGGSVMYLISVGSFAEQKNDRVFSDTKPFLKAIDLLEKEQEPTMLVIPEAVLFNSQNCSVIQNAMLDHCGKKQNKIAILDIHEGYKGLDDPDHNPVAVFRSQITSSSLSYGAAYYPWFNTDLVQESDITYKNLTAEGRKTLKMLCESTVLNLKEDQKKLLTNALKSLLIADDEADDEVDAVAIKNIHTALLSLSPEYCRVMEVIVNKKNLLPPSGAIAGIYCAVDSSRGVWKAPANVSVNRVKTPAVEITKEQMEYLNITLDGKSICVIRNFPEVGTLIWGARTLDGNSTDWRNINVRRTVIMLEQSLKLAVNAYVFEPNDANTWITVKSMMTNFLFNLWKQGALAGATPEEAFHVSVGLGSTMTPYDILDGRMIMSVKVAVLRPAEFILITFLQQLQQS